ncbi:MAG: hypothetical protein NZ866_00570 [Patescibacteria group bacterium]|nr:hypothetical protein [Patescibacteria group bacterium]
MNKFNLKIILLDGQEIEKEVEALICKTDLGELTILPYHQSIMAIVNPGEIILKIEGQKEKIYINHPAVLEFSNNQAKLLAVF